MPDYNIETALRWANELGHPPSLPSSLSTLDEKISIYQRDVPSQMLPPRANWVIEYKSTIEKNLDSNPRIEEGFDSKMIDNIFASVITAMRLVQEGSIGINSFIRYIPLDVPIYVYYIGLINPQLIFKEFSKLDVVKRGRAIHNLNLDPKRVPRNINNPKSSIDEEKAREAMFGNILRTLDEDQQKAFEQNPHVNKDFSKFIKENIQKIRLYSPNNPQWSMYEMDEDNFERLNRAYASLYPDIYEDLEHIREGLPNRIEGIRKSRLHSTRQPRNKTSKAEPRLSA